jgi:pimeloyl-ACP methyl ester carboxylesterase
MHNRRYLLNSAALLGLLASSRMAMADRKTQKRKLLATGDHTARVGDIEMFFRIAGNGPPLMLLHGGFSTADAWKPLFAPLSQQFTLIAPDSRGQGRTSGTAAPITYGRMAHDAVGLMDYLDLDAVHVVGHSDGGCNALHLLVDFGDRLKSATLVGTPFNTANYPPDVFEHLRAWMADAKEGQDFFGRREQYRKIAPHPEYWPTLVEKLGQTWLTQPQFTVGELATVRTPVLVINAGADQYLPSAVFQQLASAIPGAQTHSVPKATHDVIHEYPQEMGTVIRQFAINS